MTMRGHVAMDRWKWRRRLRNDAIFSPLRVPEDTVST